MGQRLSQPASKEKTSLGESLGARAGAGRRYQLTGDIERFRDVRNILSKDDGKTTKQRAPSARES